VPKDKTMRLSEILKQHSAALYSIISGAHDDYDKLYPPEAKLAHDASCKAHNVQRHMLARASKYAATNPENVKAFECNNLRGIICNQLVAFLFKKLNDELLSRNNETRQIEDYRHQRDIPGIPAVVKLIAGYQENDETGEYGVYVTRPSGRGNRWEMPLATDSTQPTTTPLFAEEDDLQEAEILPRTEPGKVIPLERGKKDDKDKP
jgi:hypothetical protein